ncbi:MAG: hypothetical protein ACLUHE_01175 [Christensenellales bacterium]
MTRVIARAEAVPAFKPGETPVALVGSIEDSELSVVHEGFEKARRAGCGGEQLCRDG